MNILRLIGRRSWSENSQHYLYQYDYYLHDISQSNIIQGMELVLFFVVFVVLATSQIGSRNDAHWRVVCTLMLSTGLKGLYQNIYSQLTLHRAQVTFGTLLDLLIIICSGMMLAEDYSLERVQNCSVVILLCLYCKILASISIIKWIGIYTIIIGKVVKRLAVFLTMFISVLTVLGICFNLLFKRLVTDQRNFLWSIFTEIASPLGMVDLVGMDEIESSGHSHMLQ